MSRHLTFLVGWSSGRRWGPSCGTGGLGYATFSVLLMNNLGFEGLGFRCSAEAEPAARCFSSGLVLDGQDPGHVLTGLFSVGSDTLSHASSGQMALPRRCSTSETVSASQDLFHSSSS